MAKKGKWVEDKEERGWSRVGLLVSARLVALLLFDRDPGHCSGVGGQGGTVVLGKASSTRSCSR